jgi:hypothetical protein
LTGSGRCEVSGPQVLAGVWRERAPLDTADLGALTNATRDFNDRSLVEAVAEAARRPGAAEATRIHAFALLFSYAVPGIYIDARDLLQPGDQQIGTYSVTHDTRTYHTRESLGDLRPEMGALLRAIVEAEPASRVGKAAAMVLRELRYHRES